MLTGAARLWTPPADYPPALVRAYATAVADVATRAVNAQLHPHAAARFTALVGELDEAVDAREKDARPAEKAVVWQLLDLLDDLTGDGAKPEPATARADFESLRDYFRAPAEARLAGALRTMWTMTGFEAARIPMPDPAALDLDAVAEFQNASVVMPHLVDATGGRVTDAAVRALSGAAFMGPRHRFLYENGVTHENAVLNTLGLGLVDPQPAQWQLPPRAWADDNMLDAFEALGAAAADLRAARADAAAAARRTARDVLGDVLAEAERTGALARYASAILTAHQLYRFGFCADRPWLYTPCARDILQLHDDRNTLVGRTNVQLRLVDLSNRAREIADKLSIPASALRSR